MPDRRPVVLHAVGDIALGDHPLCTGFGTHSRSRRKPAAFPFEHVSAVLASADLRFGNLECTLSERGLRRHDYHSVQMRGHTGYVRGLVETGFHVLNVANNHSMQHGSEPFEDTVNMLRGAGISVCGVSRGSASAAVVATVHGLRVGFLGYSLRPRQYFTERPLYAEGWPEGMVADVRAVRPTCDILVVSLHWGDEFIDRPSPADVQLAHAIVDAGADLIVGHHPHVLRGVERYGRGWIVYSLGNFVCDMLWSEDLRETAICECRLTGAGVEDVRLIPVRINDDCQPVPLSGEAATRLERRLAELSTALTQPEAASTSHRAAADYEAAAYRAHSGQRARSHRYFLRNAFRFPPRILASQLTTYVRNRLAERGWTSQTAG
jgi:poly-gamma-glutamate capsule biosynthesis protein CapA/YwtB (metallophosphatase superfamily)